MFFLKGEDDSPARAPRTLQERIAAGLADPISELERDQLKALEELYLRRFGKRLNS